MSGKMKCSYGLSSRLPSYRKYFSCSYTCFNKNVVDICEGESDFEDSFLIDKVVQEKLIEAISISNLSEQIMNVFENSHLEDALALTKEKKKKMKRRKKMRQKPRQKCDVIRENELHESPNLSFFEKRLSVGEMTDCSSFFMNYPRRCFDNTSYSHITSEKDSVYSEDRIPKRIVVRKRKKIQRRKKRRTTKTRANCFNVDRVSLNSSELGDACQKDITGSAKNLACSDEEVVVDRKPSEEDTNDKENHNLPETENCDEFVDPLPIKTINTENETPSKVLGVVTKIVAKDAKIIGTGTTTHCEDLNTKCQDLKLIDSTYDINTDTILDPYTTKPRKSIEDEKFSKEQRRQLRRKMRNVKKRPESYVVLGLI